MGAHHALSSPKAPVRFTIGTPATSGTDLGTYTFSSVSFGTAAEDRIVGCAIGSRANAARNLIGVTIGGTAVDWFQWADDTGGGSDMVGLAIRRVPTGTSGDIVVEFSANMLRCGIIPFVVYGTWGGSMVTPFDTQEDVDLSVMSVSSAARVGSLLLGASWVGGTDHTLTWGGITHDATVDVETTGGELSIAHAITNTVANINVTATVSGGAAASGALITLTIPAG